MVTLTVVVAFPRVATIGTTVAVVTADEATGTVRLVAPEFSVTLDGMVTGAPVGTVREMVSPAAAPARFEVIVSVNPLPPATVAGDANMPRLRGCTPIWRAMLCVPFEKVSVTDCAVATVELGTVNDALTCPAAIDTAGGGERSGGPPEIVTT